MNTNKLKAYAPKARLAFMEAVTKRAAFLGLYADRIAEMTIDGDSAVIEGRVFTRQQGQQRTQLVKRIEALGTNNGKFVLKDGFNQFINETAFTWFNRLTAIRYMEVNEYLDHGYRVLSNGENAKFGEGFEILGSAADVADDLGLDKESIIDMVLDGNKEEELYRAILLGQCHQLSEAMPFMFEALDDATELLLPDNLTKTDSILKDLVNDIPEDNWQEIEVIGWLYQFYISEHKDAVIGKVVKREDIPAATQLFTPNWIVKYLVQNSLGRQWLATYPDSELKEKMEYYITPAEQSDDVIEQLKAITPTSIDPEEIKVLDPACGSGHILVEVYEVLREIYLERGYRPREIPELILTKNIYGLDIDDRAAQMAAFAVMMKAREDDKRIFSRDIKLNIHSIQSTENLNINQLWADLDLDGKQKTGSMGDLFAEPQLGINEVSAENKVYLDLLRYLKEQFIDAKNLGSLIEVDGKHCKHLLELQNRIIDISTKDSQLKSQAVKSILPIIQQAITLAITPDTIIANPPYMGFKYFNPHIKDKIFKDYPEAKHDLYSAFVLHFHSRMNHNGYLSFMTPFTWMFLPSFKKFRDKLLNDATFESIVRPEYHSFFESAYVPICAFSIRKEKISNYLASYFDLNDFYGAELQPKKLIEAIIDDNCPWKRAFSANLIQAIPESVFALELKSTAIDAFKLNEPVSNVAYPKQGIKTGDNDRFLRYWHEVDFSSIELNAKNSADYTWPSDKSWCPIQKGGAKRRWYGNNEFIVQWKDNGHDLKNFFDKNGKLRSRPQNLSFAHREGTTWTTLTVGDFSMRYSPRGFLSESAGSICYSDSNIFYLLGLFNSSVMNYYMKAIAPTLSYSEGNVGKIPVIFSKIDHTEKLVQEVVDKSKMDWDLSELSWDFSSHFLVSRETKLTNSWEYFSNQRIGFVSKLCDLEHQINHHFIHEYGLDDVLQSCVKETDVTIRKITRGIAISSFCSFGIACIMGRYSLDRKGLVYAHSGNEGFKELVAEGAYKTFPADDDGIVPLADEEWLFDDDATTRFREFVKTVWGEEHLSENLDFVAESLCLDAIKPKKGESSMDTIRRYFSTQFFKDHLKTYKKRPIYWLFSSGKEKAFECLVYLHRYNESTLSRMRTEYVTPLMGKLESRKNILEDSKATATGAELRAIDKELKTIDKKQAELVKFDEELKHLAEMKISIDLDDGVKVNYGKFGNLLADVKAIHGKAPEKIK
ncbi:TPA: BREX-1 system adenine-specific DNA-methyltransferase PglX [Photobacterium damselae]